MPACSAKNDKYSVQVQQENLNFLTFPTSHPTKKLLKVNKNNETPKESLILEMLFKEEDTEILCLEHEFSSFGSISGHGSKGWHVCVCRRQSRGLE